MSCIITKNVCGFEYYRGTFGRWEGLISNAQQLTEATAQKLAAELIRKGENVFIKVYNPKK